MATKVKGILKGLRYISQIFDEKEHQEIQIGLPTDVKHVAHIGWDGPSTNSTPSWMTEFKSPQESTGQLAVRELSAQDINKTGLAIAQELVQLNEIPKSTSSHSKKSSDGTIKKSSRRNRSTEAGSDSPARESSNRNSRKSRNSNGIASESPANELPAVPKHRKKKGSTEGGSTRSSRRPRSRGQNSLTNISIEGSENGSVHGGSPMHPAFAGDMGSEVISTGIRA